MIRIFLILVFLMAHGSLGQVQTSPPRVSFSADIQPIFARSCYGCHGEKAQMGGLRLDSKQSVLSQAVRPGLPGDSELYRRVAGIGDKARMPMGAKPLDGAQIALLKRWIEEGIDWPAEANAPAAAISRHWAFVPPLRPPLPRVRDTKWARNAIDNFILARLEQEGLAPSPEADRATLLRRLSLDLTGLPPAPEDVDAFVDDKRSQAYERQVDRLLASPHYGERWGRHWLDGARYADSDGYEKDKPRDVWFYRDWVINALNRDLPYNQFLIEQIAGDLLPDATQDQRVATGFLRNSMVNEEGGIDPEQFRMEAMFDRMDAIGKSILGITIQCAQCHNHKYDPLQQEEYYRLFAFLNNSHEGSATVHTPAQEMKRAEIFRKTQEIEADLRHRTADWEQRMAAWEKAAANQPEWVVVKPEVEDISTGGQKYVLAPDDSMLASGYAPTKHRVQFMFKTDKPVSAFRLELLTDPNLPMGGPGRSIKGTGALTEFEVEVAPASDPQKKKAVKILRATADINPAETLLDKIFYDKTDRRRVTGPIEFAIDGKEETAWGIDAGPGRRNQPRKAVFALETPIVHEGGSVIYVYLSQKHGGWNSDDNQSNNLGRMRLSVTTAANAEADPLPHSVRATLSVPREKRTPAQRDALFSFWRTTVAEFRDANYGIEELWRAYPEPSSQLVLAERESMRPTFLLTRGDFLKPAAPVASGVPAFLHPLPEGAAPNRLTFARWLADRRSPTTARSMVNRIWQAYFGTGIVSTSEDLGRQSETPSHPELLDWLAVDFMDKGWSLKQIHRLIVKSAAYRQTSRIAPDLLSKDPYNRLLARGPRFRVESEIVRDIALSASGLLNPRVGGPSVYPSAPEFLFQPPASYGPKIWDQARGDDRYRRALYTFRYRSVPHPALQVFDTPNGDMSCVRRTRSNTPLQALTTLNEIETAQALARKTLAEGGLTDRQRANYAFRRCLSRKPSEGELVELTAFVEKQRGRLRDGWVNAWALAGLKEDGNLSLPRGVTPVELAAYTALSRVLLNLDETITKE